MTENRPEIKKAAQGDFDLFNTYLLAVSALLVEARRELTADLLHAMQAR